MASRSTFLDLDDYTCKGAPRNTGRIRIDLEIESPSDYYAEIYAWHTQEPVRLDELSARDRKQVDDWIEETIKDWCADQQAIYDY